MRSFFRINYAVLFLFAFPNSGLLADSSYPSSQAIDFELPDLNGKPWRLSHFRNNVVFLNFWATWCPPCVEEFPAMEELNQIMKTKPFVMIAVSIDEDDRTIQKFLSGFKGRKPTFLILHDKDKRVATDLYGLEKFPETFLVDSDGKISAHFKGSQNWTDAAHLLQIEQLLMDRRAAKAKASTKSLQSPKK